MALQKAYRHTAIYITTDTERVEAMDKENIQLFQGDCLELMKDIPDCSVDLVLTDPPYNIKKEKSWDSWKTKQCYAEFMGKIFIECQRILKNNGTMYFFHNDITQISMLMEWIRKNTDFKYNSFIVLDKGNFRSFAWKNPSENSKLRCWFNTCEYVLCYTFQDQTGIESVLKHHAFNGLQKYFAEERKKTGKTVSFLDNIMGIKSSYCYWEKPTTHAYRIPDEKNYKALQKHFGSKAFTREYESLRLEYESLRFKHNLDKDHNNVFQFRRDKGKNYHSCQKPINILERLIKCSSNENDVVLDCFMGSGSTGVACVNTGRRFIGMELEPKYFEIAKQRIDEAAFSYAERGEQCSL